MPWKEATRRPSSSSREAAPFTPEAVRSPEAMRAASWLSW